MVRSAESAELALLRDQLFESGSSFAPVQRSEIVGIDGLLERLEREQLLWLREPDLFDENDARLEPGCLLHGPPGTGKTMVARYLASCSNALFIAVRDFPIASDLINAADVADLFARGRAHYAKKKQPVQFFWDEFEIHGRRRSDALTADAEVVSELMSQLDGVHGKCHGLLFVASTNNPDAVDSALKRHGRLGRQIEFMPPDSAGKMKLLKHYLGRHLVADDLGHLDLESAIHFLPTDATAATIEEACESVWRRAVIEGYHRGTEPLVTQALLNDVLLDELLGLPLPFTAFNAATIRKLALHELGHALVARELGVLKVLTVRPGSSAFGRVFTNSEEEHGFFSASQRWNQLVVSLGSHALEGLLGLPTGSGIDGDLRQATTLAAGLVECLAQHPWLDSGWVGPVYLEALECRARYADGPIASQMLLQYFDQQVNRTLREAYQRAYGILSAVGKEVIYRLADRFAQAMTWTARQFEEVYAEVVAEVSAPEPVGVGASRLFRMDE